MSEIILRPIEIHDIALIADFLADFPDDHNSAQQWINRLHYWWQDNPAYHTGHVMGVILLDKDQIVGFTGNIPTRMLWMGKEEIVINGTTWRVLPKYRRYSMDLWLQHRDLTTDYIYLNTTPNAQVEKLLKVMKFPQLALPRDWYYFLGAPKNLTKSNLIIVGSCLQKTVSYILIFISHIFPNKILNLSINPSAKSDDIDKLWLAHKDDFQFTNVRDSKYINWISKSQKIYYIYQMNEMLGFVILSIDENKKSVILIDYWNSDIDRYAKTIVLFLLNHYRNFNVIIPAYNTYFKKAARSLFLLKRKNPNVGFIHYDEKQALDPSRSFFTMLQGDYGL